MDAVQEEIPLGQENQSKTTVSVLNCNDSSIQLQNLITFEQACAYLKLGGKTHPLPQRSCWQRVCRCWSASLLGAYAHLASLRELTFDPKCRIHQQILSTCTARLTQKPLGSVCLNKPLKLVTKGHGFSINLNKELEKKGSMASLVFMLYLFDTMGDRFDEAFRELQRTSKGPVPFLRWLNLVNPQVWDYYEKRSGGLGETLEDAFTSSRHLFEHWVRKYRNDIELAWDDQKTIGAMLRRRESAIPVDSSP